MAPDREPLKHRLTYTALLVTVVAGGAFLLFLFANHMEAL